MDFKSKELEYSVHSSVQWDLQSKRWIWREICVCDSHVRFGSVSCWMNVALHLPAQEHQSSLHLYYWFIYANEDIYIFVTLLSFITNVQTLFKRF